MNSHKNRLSSFSFYNQHGFRLGKDIVVTGLLWGYFTFGFILFFSPFYLLAFLFSKSPQCAFQSLNSTFYRGFFGLCRIIVPSHKWEIRDEVRNIRSGLILCNHISYLDSILLVSLYPRHTTIAKDRLFQIPVFGRFIALAGYLPSSGRGPNSELLLKGFENIPSILEQGGNIIVFPEGTRSRDGRVSRLHKGAFKIAKLFKAPITVLRIKNTDKLFIPGRFLFNSTIQNNISLKIVGELKPDYSSDDLSIKALMEQVYDLLSGNDNIQDIKTNQPEYES